MGGADNEFGFKLPTLDDWLQPDAAWNFFVEPGASWDTEPPAHASGESWVSDVRKAELSSKVPTEIRKLFEVAKSAIIYGYLCYPLMTLGAEQLHRISERAAKVRARELGWQPKGLPIFADAVKFLVQEGAIPTTEIVHWKATVELRNEGSHPVRQSIFLPGQVLDMLYITADSIDALFLWSDGKLPAG